MIVRSESSSMESKARDRIVVDAIKGPIVQDFFDRRSERSKVRTASRRVDIPERPASRTHLGPATVSTVPFFNDQTAYRQINNSDCLFISLDVEYMPMMCPGHVEIRSFPVPSCSAGGRSIVPKFDIRSASPKGPERRTNGVSPR